MHVPYGFEVDHLHDGNHDNDNDDESDQIGPPELDAVSDASASLGLVNDILGLVDLRLVIPFTHFGGFDVSWVVYDELLHNPVCRVQS